jgi:hypothetical protein
LGISARKVSFRVGASRQPHSVMSLSMQSTASTRPCRSDADSGAPMPTVALRRGSSSPRRPQPVGLDVSSPIQIGESRPPAPPVAASRDGHWDTTMVGDLGHTADELEAMRALWPVNEQVDGQAEEGVPWPTSPPLQRDFPARTGLSMQIAVSPLWNNRVLVVCSDATNHRSWARTTRHLAQPPTWTKRTAADTLACPVTSKDRLRPLS